MVEVIHELKVDPALWVHLAEGDKPFEIRKDDRHFQRGDILQLQRFDTKIAVNRQLPVDPLWFKVTFVLRGGQYGLEVGYVALGIKPWPAPPLPPSPLERPDDCASQPLMCDFGFRRGPACSNDECPHFVSGDEERINE